VDASFIKESNSATWGALVRNHLGLIKWSAWGVLPDCNSAEMAEALACLEGLKQAFNSVETPLIVESDCANLIKKANSPERDRSHTSSVISDIKRIGTMLPDLVFRKIPREYNSPAHELAKISRITSSGGVLHGSAPPGVQELVLRICNQNSVSV
jgi:hypothetical protein